jgi:integrase
MQAQRYRLTHESKPANYITQTIGECIDRYIDSKSNILSPVTISKYRNIRKSQLSDSFLALKLVSLSNIAAQTEINRLAGIYSAKTVYNASGLISAVVRAFRPEFNYKVTLPRREKKRKDLPTPEEVIKAFAGTDMELIVLLGLWQGLRVSEIRGLKKSDFKNGTMTINRVVVTVDGRPVEKTLAKTENSKRALQVPEAIQVLVDKVQGDYITRRAGESIYKSFKRKMKQLGYPDATFHDLRHLNASVMLMLGIPDKYAMERGGWSNTAVLKNVYQETFSSERQAVDAQIDDYFSQLAT